MARLEPNSNRLTKMPKLEKAFLEDSGLDMRTVEQKFQDNSSLEEGISGQLAIDSTYENTVRAPESSARSDWGDESMDLK